MRVGPGGGGGLREARAGAEQGGGAGGHTDADPERGTVGEAAQFGDETGDGFRGVGGARPMEAVREAAVGRGQRPDDLIGHGEVERDDLHGPLVELEHHGGLSRPGLLTGSALPDHAVGEQIAHDLRHGGAGEAGEPGQIGAAQGGLLHEGAQDEGAVAFPDAAGVAVGRRLRGSCPIGGAL